HGQHDGASNSAMLAAVAVSSLALRQQVVATVNQLSGASFGRKPYARQQLFPRSARRSFELGDVGCGSSQ
ncbi:hypothetical protein CQA20_29520, partial [Klebsiella pneumoniae]